MADVTSYDLHRRSMQHTATTSQQYTQSQYSSSPQIAPRIQTTIYPPHPQSRQLPHINTHQHSRTVSSNILPSPSYTQTTTTVTTHNRRNPSSTTTTSTMSSRDGNPARSPSSVSITLRRSGSVRSGTSFVPTSYVALMRKQKATVWCDRAQLEDPRMAAAAKAARHRAALEVSGGGGLPRMSTSTSATGSSLGVRSKITNRYHNPTKPVGYSANLLGTTGVPMRLSATEVGDEEKRDADSHSDFRGQRTGSGRSSLQNTSRLSSAINIKQSGRMSTSSTPPSANSVSPIGSAPVSASTTMVNKRRTTAEDYFAHPSGNGGSGSSGEEARFGDIGDMEAPKTQKEIKNPDDLARRGSVDERTTTMRGAVRLFVANPDLSD